MIERKNNATGTSRRDVPLSAAALYEMAEKRKIPIHAFDLTRVPSLSIIDEGGGCVIGLQPRLQGAKEHVCLAHEMGHCMTGTFYRSTTSPAVRGKCEYKADKWAFYRLIPPVALQKALDAGLRDSDELAEHFEVTEDFLMKALDFYACIQPMK